jgi:predicted  nucleic acid-binding Zn-ribbon protein
VISSVAAQPVPRSADSHSTGLHLPKPATRSVGALQDRIRQEKAQLDDWVTCVSAKTTKGQSEIQSLSARISAAQQQINELDNSQQAPTSQQASTPAARSTSSIDVWV